MRILYAVQDEDQRRRRCLVEQFVQGTFALWTKRANLQARALVMLVAGEPIQLVSVTPFRAHARGLRETQ